MPTPSKPCSNCGRPYKPLSRWNRYCRACHKQTEHARRLKQPRYKKHLKEQG